MAPQRQKAKKPPPAPAKLSGKQRSHLRSLAHSLQPVVQNGQAGLTDSVLEQIDSALESHELIKVKLSREAPLPAAEIAPVIAARLHATIAQLIGRVAVVYRQHPTEARIQLPRPVKKTRLKE